MACYAVFVFSSITPGQEIEEYATRVDETVQPFGGRFLVRGGDFTLLEGEWPGPAVVIAFEDRSAAQAWYDSAAYRRILPLRLRNSSANSVLIDGVSSDAS